MAAKRKKLSFPLFQTFNGLILTAVALSTLYPFWYVLIYSLSSEVLKSSPGILIWPEGFSLDAYEFVFTANNAIMRAYANSIFVTVTGTVLAVLITGMAGYALTKNYIIGYKAIASLMFFTMLFHGGLIPTYLLVSGIGLTDSLWALILPNVVSVFNLFLMRAFFLSLPESIEESAKIDGANDMMIFIRIVLPVSLPILATMALFYSVAYWNSFFDAMIYIDSRSRYTLPLILREALVAFDMTNIAANSGGAWSMTQDVGERVRMSLIIITTGPILLVYPFLQRYFIKGILLGAVKG